jgi:hypothetical protein
MTFLHLYLVLYLARVIGATIVLYRGGVLDRISRGVTILVLGIAFGLAGALASASPRA